MAASAKPVAGPDVTSEGVENTKQQRSIDPKDPITFSDDDWDV